MYAFGAILLFALLLQISSGITIAIHYLPSSADAFWCVNRMVRTFRLGWLVKAVHVNGASLMFLALYIHILRSFYYRSYVFPRRLVWLVGSLIYVLLLLSAFLGSVLPWSQTSYWSTVVITNFVGAIPLFGSVLKLLTLGGFSVDDSTLKRFFVFHCILPFFILLLVVLHIALVHIQGQVNPVDIKQPMPKSAINAYPKFVLKDVAAITAFLLALCVLCLLTPNLLTNPSNYSPADYLSTPSDIRPEWYFLPYFSILKNFESKTFGIFAAIATTLFIVFLPFTHNKLSPSSLSAAYKPASVLVFLSLFIMSFLGRLKPTTLTSTISKLCTSWYFWFFLLPPISLLISTLKLLLLRSLDGHSR
ncbi:MAG: cytochrome bc complex cytochrome b subunit [Candidatus Hodgkinia cicadicola]